MLYNIYNEKVNKYLNNLNIRLFQNGDFKMSNPKRGDLSKDQTAKFQSFANVSTQIRYLTSLNWTRSEIVKYISKNGLNKSIRYQHVRNVQITPITNPAEKF